MIVLRVCPLLVACVVVGTVLAGGTAAAATFDCGSNGSDGALVFVNPAVRTTVLFDPSDTTMVGRVLDADHDAVYHFTEIHIPANVTLRLRADKAGWSPMYWLSQGDVLIEGAVDLSGEPGGAASDTKPMQPSIPGPGGYPGAWGASSALGISGQNGFGPGADGYGGKHPGNYFLQPLTGGSGAGSSGFSSYGGGGAGGGALLLASNSSVIISGTFRADGGIGGIDSSTANRGGTGGAGGAIRILAPTASGAGTISLLGGLALYPSHTYDGEAGWLRIESNNFTFTGTINTTRTRVVTLVPSATRILPPASLLPAARVIRVNGIDVPLSPTGSFEVPDLVLNTDQPVVFELQASQIPLGTKFNIMLWNETTQVTTLQTSGLAGTLAASTGTVSAVVPNGLSRGFVYGTWTNP